MQYLILLVRRDKSSVTLVRAQTSEDAATSSTEETG